MRSFPSQSEARQFFVTKIIEEAQREGVPLSEGEQRMLLWSESAPDSVADPALALRLAAEISDAVYEEKIVGLLRSSFKRAIAVNPATKEVWRTARTVLAQGDHYLTIMIDEAIGGLLKPWWQVW